MTPAAPPTDYRTYQPLERNGLLAGMFNLGFLAVANDAEGQASVSWWAARCRYLCFADVADGLFLDQKWVDLAMVLFPNAHVLRHYGYNVARWNLHERTLAGRVVNERDPLAFYHFSGVHIEQVDAVTKHGPSIRWTDREDVKELVDEYRALVRANGYAYFSRRPYSYGFFFDGTAISTLERRLLASAPGAIRDPFAVPGGQLVSILRRHHRRNRSARAQERSFGVMAVKAVLRGVFRLLGPRRYERLVAYLRGLDRLRYHGFLAE